MIKYQQKFKSKKEMVSELFNKDISFLPSGQEILYGLMLATIDHLGRTTYFEEVEKIWMKLFPFGKLTDMKKPLTIKILSDPSHDFVKLLLYIYSMESFVFKEMNIASRDKDQSKI